MSPFWRYKLDHILFWTATVLFHMYTRWSLIGQAGAGQFILEIVVRNGLLALLIYANSRLLIRRFAGSGSWPGYGVLLGCLILSYALIKDVHDAFQRRHIDTLPFDLIHQTFYNISIAIFYTAFSVALELSRQWSRQREQLRQIAFDQVNTELAYLKAQINPHFLFNSINTIYFQIDKGNRTAREMLSAFSDMLRYQLYECNGSRVAIEREIAYLRNYVDLQRTRKDENYQINFVAGKNMRDFEIAPLLLIPFVENAFKHVSHVPGANRIDITLTYEAPVCRLIVHNTKERSVAKSEGIGLRNVKRRLELLYPDCHKLLIEEQDSTFRVQLDITVEKEYRVESTKLRVPLTGEFITHEP